MMHPIPNAALDDRLAFVGTAGSGKTYNAGSGVERLLERKARVIVADPLGVWYGLRLMPDGKSPSPYPVVIFGGPHGDIGINEHAGGLIGETVAGMAESCILDLSQIGTKAGERRFMLAFLTALYRRASGEPVHLVIDEADMFAPQRLLDKDGEAAKLLGMMETIVRRGRVKGFIPWLISQRPAVLSKDVLSQADGMVAFKLTASQDRDAIGAWIEGQADKQQGKEILASLPSMQRGQGVVWVPGRGILANSTFPEKHTFDSSRTPKRGETVRARQLKPIDLGALKDRLSSVEQEAKANDPKALRQRIATLERELAAKPAAAADHNAVAASHQDGMAAGFNLGFDAGVTAAANAWMPIIEAIRTSVPQTLPNPQRPEAPETKWTPRETKRLQAQVRQPLPIHRMPPRQPTNGASASLPKAERRILTALAQYPGGRTKNQVAVLTGYAVNGGGFNNAVSSLRSAGRLTGGGDRLEITDAGAEDLGPFDPLPTGQALLQHWLSQLGKAERSTLAVLADAYPAPIDKESLATAAGYAAEGGGFNNALSRLRTLELVSGRGELRASDDLFG